MSGSNGTCEYILDPSDPETWGGEEGDECLVRPDILNDEGNWSCPHHSGENRFCIFHRPIKNKDNEEAINRLTKLASHEENKSVEILNSKFENINISKIAKNTGPDSIIDMTQSDILGKLSTKGASIKPELLFTQIYCQGEINMANTTFDSPVDLTGSSIQGGCELYRSTFKDDIDFSSAEINGKLDCGRANFRQYAGFGAEFHGIVSFGTKHRPEASATFYGPGHFSGAEFHQEAIFAGVKFHENAQFAHIEVKNESDAYFARMDFTDYVSFWDSEFDGTVDFTGTYFEATVDFREAKFYSECWFQMSTFYDSAYFEDVEFNKKVKFFRVDFNQDVDFTNGEIATGSEFNRCKFYEKAIFSNCDLIDCTFANSDVSGALFNNIKMTDSNFESAILNQAALFGADLRGAKLSGALLGDVRIDEDTRFLGLPDDDSNYSPHTFSAIRSKPCCVYDPNYEGDNDEVDVDKAKSVYRALEELASGAARPRLQSQCFVRRQDLQKDGYKRDVKEAESWQERLIAGGRYSRAKVARGTLLYGESPWRIIGGSFGFICLVALLYPLGEWLRPVGEDPITYTRIAENPELFLESLYFSTLTFTTLGMGDYEPMGFGQVLATLNTTLGAVLIALLVFVLGRRAAR